MAKTKSPVELASEFVTENMEKAKAAFSMDAGSDLSKQAAAYQARVAELQAKALEMVEANAKAGFAFWREAVAAKSPETFVSLQQSFLKSQSEAVMRQVQDMNAMTTTMLRDVAQPMQDNWSKAFAMFQPKAA